MADAPYGDVDRGVVAAIDSFLAYLKRRGRAEHTLVKYRQVLLEFAVWLAWNDLTLLLRTKDVEFGYLQDWYERFLDGHGREPSQHSQRNRISALKSFYAFLDKKELLVAGDGRYWRNPMLGIDPVIVAREPIRWLQRDEDEALLATEMNDQERIVVHFLRWTGTRVDEGTSVLIQHLSFARGDETVWIEKSKTPSGRRGLPLFPELAPELDRWLTILRRRGLYVPQRSVLCTWKGTPMTNGYVWRLVKRVALRAGVQLRETSDGEVVSAVSPHTLRSTFGSHLLNNDPPVRLEVVSELLGHADTRVTSEHYAELLKQTVRREVLAALTPSQSRRVYAARQKEVS